MSRWLMALGLFFLATFPASAEQRLSELQVRAQIQGAVRQPGIYMLPTGSRVAELMARAGGPRPDARLSGLNLARRLTDGELCYVPSTKEAQAPAQPPAAQAPARKPARAAARPTFSGKINLNTATAAQLDSLPGVGPGLAAAILKLRARQGRFKSVEDLRQVPGVGAKRYSRLRPYVEI